MLSPTRFDFRNFEAATSALLGLLEEENMLLRTRDYQKVAALQAEKTRLGNLYEQEFNVIRANPQLALSINTEQKIYLRSLSQKFDAVASENIILLSSAREIGIRIMECIRDAALEQKEQHTGYNHIINPNAVSSRKSGNAVSVSLNEKL